MKTNNVLIVNKPTGMTSRDVINELNKIYNTKQIGHTGTLDPIACGVLVVCIGQATKLVELLTSSSKEYIAKIKLGMSTDTLDITGNVLKTSKVPSLSKEQIEKALNSFLGKSIQEVPIYSAVKVNGKRLYEYARNKEEVSLPKREIETKNIELLDYDNDTIEFKTTVSKGTYIRSLIQDICLKLNTIGTMESLVRTKQGKFSIEDSYTLDQIKNHQEKLLDMQDVINFKKVELTDKEYKKIKNGSIIDRIDDLDYIAFIYNKCLVAIYQVYQKDLTKMKPYKIFDITK